MEVKSNFCPTCGEQNNPAFENCHKCGVEIRLPQRRTQNGISIFSSKEFLSTTFGGRPKQMDMTVYEGHPFQCVCGKPHNFSDKEIQVLRELPKMRLVFACPENEGVVCVHLKGFLKFSGFETLFGALNGEDVIDIS